ncbi:MAG: hypothetical protein LUO93_00990 [Methanomicrobiales archaeon]|nr:hypothetical protein [Methanomicrobiales archaeon]
MDLGHQLRTYLLDHVFGDQFSDLANARKPLNEYRGLHNLFCKVGYGDIVDNLTPRYLQKRSWGE